MPTYGWLRALNPTHYVTMSKVINALKPEGEHLYYGFVAVALATRESQRPRKLYPSSRLSHLGTTQALSETVRLNPGDAKSDRMPVREKSDVNSTDDAGICS